jgi:hypothetical protein
MFEGWTDFYLMAGGAAAVLMGLIFVVITLLQDKPRSTITTGSRLYMGPIVLHMSLVLTLCGAALAPPITGPGMAAVAGAAALWGFIRGVYSFVGIRRLMHGKNPPHWTDQWFYGVATAILYALLGLVAWGFFVRAGWAVLGLGAVIVAILLLSVRNEWDLVTWIAPRASDGKADLQPDPSAGQEWGDP